jgi:hypothetical protein
VESEEWVPCLLGCLPTSKRHCLRPRLEAQLHAKTLLFPILVPGTRDPLDYRRHHCSTVPEWSCDPLGKLLTYYDPKIHVSIREVVGHYVDFLDFDIVASKASGFFSVHIPISNLPSTSFLTSTTPLPPLSFMRSRLSAVKYLLVLSRSTSSYGIEAQICPSRSSSVGCVFSKNEYYILSELVIIALS